MKPLGELHQIFAPFYWKAHVEETQQILDKCLSKISDSVDQKPIAVPPEWECIIHSSFNSNDPSMQLDSNYLNNIYNKYITAFLNEFNVSYGPAMIFDPWYNVFSHNHFQEAHAHLPNDFSMVHYLLFDEQEHSATTFVNPNPNAAECLVRFRPQLIDRLNKRNTKHSFCMTNFTALDIKQGDLIIFPAYLTHFVKPNTSTKKRITITLNIQLA